MTLLTYAPALVALAAAVAAMPALMNQQVLKGLGATSSAATRRIVRIFKTNSEEPVLSTDNRGLALTSLGVLAITTVACAGLTITFFAASWTTSSAPCIAIGESNSCQISAEASAISTEDAQELRSILPVADSGPSGGPWPFLVYNTRSSSGIELGLRVKSNPNLDGAQIGAVGSDSIVWADCQVSTEFNPATDTVADVGAVWLRVRWKGQLSGEQFGYSTPDATATGYIYAGYVLSLTDGLHLPPACQ